MAEIDFASEKFWSQKWVSHIERYLVGVPRCGVWLKARFGSKCHSVLECAGGSCRDSRYLFDAGFGAVGSDFDQATVDYLKKRFGESKFEIKREDAAALTCASKSFDLVFHNGFWVCFDDDSFIDKLLVEQSRVAKKYLVAIVHNGENHALVDRFSSLAKSDSIYDIRFFRREQLLDIFLRSGVRYKKVNIEKFGGFADILYDVADRYKYFTGLMRWVVPRIYKFQPWGSVERLALIVELE